jgi:hypothetical protein
MVVSGFIHAPVGLLEDKGPHYRVSGWGAGGAHNNSRHDILIVSFIWLDVDLA